MDREEFKKLIENGRDIMFDVAGKRLTILTWWDDGILIAEQGTEKNKSIFKNEEALLKEYLINGVPLGNLAKDILITNYS